MSLNQDLSGGREAMGFYYLHENGDLIYKRFEPEQDPGGFVKKVWEVTPFRETAWKIAVEALAAGARRERVMDLARKWSLTDEDGLIYASRIHVTLFHAGESPNRIGTHWEVGPPGAPNPCGITVLDALAEYVRGGGRLP